MPQTAQAQAHASFPTITAHVSARLFPNQHPTGHMWPSYRYSILSSNRYTAHTPFFANYILHHMPNTPDLLSASSAKIAPLLIMSRPRDSDQSILPRVAVDDLTVNESTLESGPLRWYIYFLCLFFVSIRSYACPHPSQDKCCDTGTCILLTIPLIRIISPKCTCSALSISSHRPHQSSSTYSGHPARKLL